MRTVNIAELPEEAMRIVRHAEETGEAVLVVRESQPAVYLVDAKRYDEMTAELRRLREEDLVRRVLEARADVAAGQMTRYDDAEELFRDLGLEDA